MSDYKDKLIDIYASHKVSQINDTIPGYADLIKQYKEHTPFHSFRGRLASIKQYLETTVEAQSSERGQVSEALKCIRKIVKDRDKEMLTCCCQLIEKAYGEYWNENQKRYFKYAAAMLNLDYDYFLSFTRRNPSVENRTPSIEDINIVNTHYEFFIEKTLGIHSLEDRHKENLLAKSIHHILSGSGQLKGFCYTDCEEDSRVVLPKLLEAVENSRVFLQLVQNVMLEKPREENWCFIEYQKICEICASNIDEKRIKFLLAEGARERLKRQEEVGLSYTDWYDYIASKANMILEFTKTELDAKKINEKIENELEQSIIDYRSALINDVPV